MVRVVVKRDGARVPFNRRKIIDAVTAAMNRANQYDPEIARRISEDIEAISDEVLEVEEIQDLVESALMDFKLNTTAREYITYRDKRTKERERNSTINKQIEAVLNGTNVQNSNANVDELSYSGKKAESSNIMHKQISLDAFMRPEVAQAHRESRIYIHDLSEYDIGSHNCLFADVGHLLSNGFCTRNGDVRPANSFSTACQLVAVIFQCQSQVRMCLA